MKNFSFNNNKHFNDLTFFIEHTTVKIKKMLISYKKNLVLHVYKLVENFRFSLMS